MHTIVRTAATAAVKAMRLRDVDVWSHEPMSSLVSCLTALHAVYGQEGDPTDITFDVTGPNPR